MDVFVVININMPGVTVPDTEAFIVFELIISVFPEIKLELPTIKFGLIVYADEVCNK
jgi:hypothetical protein